MTPFDIALAAKRAGIGREMACGGLRTAIPILEQLEKHGSSRTFDGGLLFRWACRIVLPPLQAYVDETCTGGLGIPCAQIPPVDPKQPHFNI